jgi:hypothetical protein
MSVERKLGGVVVHDNRGQSESYDQVVVAVHNHPQYTAAAFAAQKQLGEIQGRRHSWFCGAWTGYGFNEDGPAVRWPRRRRICQLTRMCQSHNIPRKTVLFRPLVVGRNKIGFRRAAKVFPFLRVRFRVAQRLGKQTGNFRTWPSTKTSSKRSAIRR